MNKRRKDGKKSIWKKVSRKSTLLEISKKKRAVHTVVKSFKMPTHYFKEIIYYTPDKPINGQTFISKSAFHLPFHLFSLLFIFIVATQRKFTSVIERGL